MFNYRTESILSDMNINPSMFSVIICKLDLPYACGFNGIYAIVIHVRRSL